MSINIQPIGEINTSVLEYLRLKLEDTFGCPITIAQKVSIPPHAYRQSRKQYVATDFIVLLNSLKNNDDKVLGVVDIDLFAPGLNFVLGQADMDSGTSIISLYRLKQELYGLPPDEELFLERMVKEAIHELGHTFGLEHCPDKNCVMHFSNTLADTDWKQSSFCNMCHPKLIP
jgi:archaemetzincin